jgi:lipopolysaccharide/colanic/teichoic acid biosynthesis glycosyltransferase
LPEATDQRRTSRARPDSVGALAHDSSPLALRYKARNMVTRPQRVRRRDRATRLLNVMVACIGIVITAPLMLVIAIAVKLSSPGPVIFTQPRVGLDRRRRGSEDPTGHRRGYDHGGRIFTIYKFRTMRPEGARSSQRWASKDDPRITLLGRVLRATRLDELPQFFNVLKGDMNIVGPRPEQPEIFAELHSELGTRYRTRQRVLPGITGLAQVNLGYDTDLDGVRKKVDMDLAYIRQRSAQTDLGIMAKTVPVMVFRKVWM